MKKILLISICVLNFYNFTKVHAAVSASVIPEVNGNTWKNLKAIDFVKLSAKDFSRLNGKKLTLKEKISFSILKMKMRKEIKKNANLTVGEYVARKKRLGTGWIILISVAGAFLLFILAFIISGGLDFGT